MPTPVISSIIPAGGGDYTSLSNWESGEQGDFVTLDVISVAECQTGLSTDTVTISGSTTDATRYIHIRNAAGHHHGGLKTAGFRITNSGPSGHVVTVINDDVKIEGIVSICTASINRQCFTINNTAGLLGQLFKCIADGSGTITGAAVLCSGAGGMDAYNNVIIDATNGLQMNNASGTMNAYNNTIHGCTTGILQSAGTVRPKNNTVQDGTTNYSGTFTGSETNISSDATSPTVALRNISLTFEDKANDNFHLASGDTAARGTGTDLSADANLAFSDDIDGDARPAGNWDIGADQFVAAAAGGVPSGLLLLGVGS